MTDIEPSPITVYFTAEIRLRIRRVTKKLKMTMSQLIREAAIKEVERYEEKFRAEDELKKQDRVERRAGLRPADDPLAPKQSPLAPALFSVPTSTPQEKIDPLQPLYDEHARAILKALDDPAEKRLRVHEAMAAVKRRAPLTCPDDVAIVNNLERAVVRLRESAPTPTTLAPAPPSIALAVPEKKGLLTRVVDALTDTIVDTGKVRSHGDVDEDEGEK